MCWAYDVASSSVESILWINTEEDISVRLKLKIGLLQAQGFQHHEALAQVASKIFGSSTENTNKPEALPQEQIVAQFNEMMG